MYVYGKWTVQRLQVQKMLQWSLVKIAGYLTSLIKQLFNNKNNNSTGVRLLLSLRP